MGVCKLLLCGVCENCKALPDGHIQKKRQEQLQHILVKYMLYVECRCKKEKFFQHEQKRFRREWNDIQSLLEEIQRQIDEKKEQVPIKMIQEQQHLEQNFENDRKSRQLVWQGCNFNKCNFLTKQYKHRLKEKLKQKPYLGRINSLLQVRKNQVHIKNKKQAQPTEKVKQVEGKLTKLEDTLKLYLLLIEKEQIQHEEEEEDLKMMQGEHKISHQVEEKWCQEKEYRLKLLAQVKLWEKKGKLSPQLTKIKFHLERKQLQAEKLSDLEEEIKQLQAAKKEKLICQVEDNFDWDEGKLIELKKKKEDLRIKQQQIEKYMRQVRDQWQQDDDTADKVVKKAQFIARHHKYMMKGEEFQLKEINRKIGQRLQNKHQVQLEAKFIQLKQTKQELEEDHKLRQQNLYLQEHIKQVYLLPRSRVVKI